MKSWYTSSELSGLPGLPGSDRSIRRIAGRESWCRRVRLGRGAIPEYHIDSLPPETRAALAARALTSAMSIFPPSNEGEKINMAPASAVSTADLGLALTALRDEGAAGIAEARLEILGLFDRYVAAAGAPVVEASFAFAALYGDGRIAVSAPTRRLVPAVSGPTLRRWRRARGKAGLAGLIDKSSRRRKGKGRIETDDEVRDLIVGVIAHQPHANAKQVMRGLRARFRDAPGRVPGYRTVQRFITNWKATNESAFLMHSDPDAWKSRRRAAFGSASEKVIRLNQLWELDSTSAEVMLQDGRHAIVACLDVYSRRGMILVTRTSRSAAIVSLLRRTCLEWGVPEAVKTDNGKDYVSAHMERALRGLAIEQETCTPFSPEQKPHVERFIGTVTHDLFEQLPGYLGHNVADRKSIESRRSFAERFGGAELFSGALALTAAELQVACDAWASDIYGRERHGGIGKSPFQAAAEWTGAVSRVDDERALDVLLAEAPGTHGVRTVGKKGIAVEGTFFIAPELGAWCGRKVHVRLDAADMGRIYVFAADTSEFICVAEAPERTGADRREIASHARELQRRIVRDGVKEIRATARRVKAHTLIDEVLDHAAEQAGRVTAFPRPSERHETPGLAAAASALGPRKLEPGTITADTLTDEQRAFAAAEFARIEARAARAARDSGDGGSAAEGRNAEVLPFPGAPRAPSQYEGGSAAGAPRAPSQYEGGSAAGAPRAPSQYEGGSAAGAGADPASLSDSDYLRWALAHAASLTPWQWDEARAGVGDAGMRFVCDIESEEAGLAALGPRPADKRKEIP